MPNSPQTTINAAQLATNTLTIEHVTYALKLITPLVVIIVGFIIWAWKKMEDTQGKLETAFIDHVKENDDIHDKLFTESREINHKLDVLLGEHGAQMRNNKDGC
jgi:hypothetical protein